MPIAMHHGKLTPYVVVNGKNYGARLTLRATIELKERMGLSYQECVALLLRTLPLTDALGQPLLTDAGEMRQVYEPDERALFEFASVVMHGFMADVYLKPVDEKCPVTFEDSWPELSADTLWDTLDCDFLPNLQSAKTMLFSLVRAILLHDAPEYQPYNDDSANSDGEAPEKNVTTPTRGVGDISPESSIAKVSDTDLKTAP